MTCINIHWQSIENMFDFGTLELSKCNALRQNTIYNNIILKHAFNGNGSEKESSVLVNFAFRPNKESL